MTIPKKFLAKFSIITDECTAIVQSLQTVDRRLLVDDGNPRYLVPLRAIAIENKEIIDQLLLEDDSEHIDIELVQPFFLTGVLWADKILTPLDLPVKGENLIATFAYGDLDELRCEGLVTMGKIKPTKYKLNR